jgi:hypothetical protein
MGYKFGYGIATPMAGRTMVEENKTMENTITSTWLGLAVRLMKATAVLTIIFVLSGILMGLATNDDYVPADATYPVAVAPADEGSLSPTPALTAAESESALAASASMQ